MPSSIALCLAGLLLLPISCAAQAGPTAAAHYPSSEDLRNLHTVRGAKLSPDAKSAVAVIADTTAEGGKTHLWLIDTAGGPPRQLTYSPDADKTGERSPQWMPDGNSLLFLAHRGEHTSLFRLPMTGGEAKAYDLKVVPAVDASKRSDAVPLDAIKRTESKATAETAEAQGSKTPEKKPADDTPEPAAIDVAGYSIAPDGHTIAVIIQDPQTPGEKRQKDAKADAEWVDHDPHVARLYLLDPATGKLTATSAKAEVRQVSWSPDSNRLLVVSEEPNGASDLAPANSLSILTAARPTAPEALPAIPPTVDDAAWSRDGSSILYVAQAR